MLRAFRGSVFQNFRTLDYITGCEMNDRSFGSRHLELTLDLAIEAQADGFATIVNVDKGVAETLEELGPYAGRAA